VLALALILQQPQYHDFSELTETTALNNKENIARRTFDRNIEFLIVFFGGHFYQFYFNDFITW